MKPILSVPELKRLIARKERLLEKHRTELSALGATLKSVCQHDHVRVDEKYVDGGYYNRAYTETNTVCEDCNTVINHNIEYHSHYG